jgi:hypothetical protein
MASAFEGVSEDPLLGLRRHVEKGFEVIETERSSFVPGPRLILEWAGEG